MYDLRPIITARPESGQCWMCHRRDTVPAERRDLIPALCSTPCEEGWADQYRIEPEATHVVADDEWVPIGSVSGFDERLNEIAGKPAVDQVVAEAGPPVTPVTAAELEELRRQQPPARPVPGVWLRNVLSGVFR